MRNNLRALIGVVGFLTLCEIAGRSGLAPRDYLPPPSVVLTELVSLLGQQDFLLDAIATVLAWLIALGISALIAVPLGLLLGTRPMVRTAVTAVIEFLRPIPAVALIPLLLVLMGSGPGTKIFLAVYAGVWPLLFNTIYAVAEIDRHHVETAKAFTIPSPRILFQVKLPSVAPALLTGFRLSASVALIVVISTEILAGSSGGLGHFIFLASSGGGRMDQVLAGTVLAGVLGYLMNLGMAGVQRRWMPWTAAGGTT